jgi:outer membrane protein OmpA-like peptidoglycan-associated protein
MRAVFVFLLSGILLLTGCGQNSSTNNDKGSSTGTAGTGSVAMGNATSTNVSSDAGSDLVASSSDLTGKVSDLEASFSLSADMMFDYDKADLKPAAEPELIKVANVLKQKSKGFVKVTGYTDSKGEDNYNLNLSERRAQAVANWLIAHGIDMARIAIEGKGEANPVAPNEGPNGQDNPEGRQQNRRVVIVLKKSG